MDRPKGKKRVGHILLGYAIAILIAFAALYLRRLLAPYLGKGNPYHTAWFAVAVSSWYLELGPSVLTLIIETLGVWYFFLPPPNSFHLADSSLLGGLVGFFAFGGLMVAFGEAKRRSVARRKTAEEQNVADLEAMTQLLEVGNRCVREGYEFERCLDAILAAAIEITDADKGNVQLLDRTSGALILTAQRGFEEPFLKFFAAVRCDESACGAAMQTGERVIVEDVTQSAIFVAQPSLDVMIDAGARAVQSTPLVSSRGNLLGMISTHFRQPHRPSERDLRFMDLLARQAADYLERKRAEDAIRVASEQLRRFLDTAATGLVHCSRELRYLAANRAFAEVAGVPVDQIIGRSVVEILGAEAWEEIRPRVERVLQGERVEFEALVPFAGGGPRYEQAVYVPEIDDAGRVVGWVASVTDISALKRAEAELQKARAELEQKVEQRTSELTQAN